MANPSQLPDPGVYTEPRVQDKPNTASIHPVNSPADEPDANSIGPRKLIRPTLPARALEDRSFNRRNEAPLLAHQSAMHHISAGQESTHAEAFYFQKQAQMQTLIVFVLEDGETIEGYIEWYDRNAIKVRNGTRTLIYKSSIKYLYKAGENHSG